MSVTSLNGIQNAVTAVSLNAGLSISTAGQELNFNALSGGVTSVIADGQSTAGDITLVGAGGTTITNDGNNTITITSSSSGGTSIANGTPPNSGSVSIDTTGNVSCNNSASIGANQNFEAGNNFQAVAGNLVSLAGNSVQLSDVAGGISMIPSFNGGLQILQSSGASLIMEGGAGVMTLNATDGTNTSQLSLGNLDGLGYSTLSGSQQLVLTSQTRVDTQSPLITLGPASGSACDIQLNGTVSATSPTTLNLLSSGVMLLTSGVSPSPYSQIQVAGNQIDLGTEGGVAGDGVFISIKNTPDVGGYTYFTVTNSVPDPGDAGWVFTRTNLYLNGAKVLGP
jgi:hypothetical protein